MRAPAALHPASHSASPQASHSARGRHYFPAGRWAPSSPGLSWAAFQLLPLGSSVAEVPARRRPLDGTGFVLRRVPVAGNRMTSCRDEMGQSRRRLGMSAQGPEADFRFLPSAEALFPEAERRAQGGFVCAAEPRPSCLPGLEEPSRARGPGLGGWRGGGGAHLCTTFSFRFELSVPVPARGLFVGFCFFSCSKIL